MKNKVLIIGMVWPEPQTTAAGNRMLQLIELFRDQGCEIHFASVALQTNYSYPLGQLDVTSHEIQLNDSSFDRWVFQLDPDIVLFDRFATEEQFSWRVREQCPRAIRILDTEDLHLLREARRTWVESGESTDIDYLLNNSITHRELSSIMRSDLSLIISEIEMTLLIEQFKLDPLLLWYLPFLIRADEIKSSELLPGFSERKGFMSIGNWKHKPNRDSMFYLKDEIWPRIRSQLPGAEIHIFGAYANGKASSLHDPSAGFLIKGWTPSKKKAFSSSRVCLAPLRMGAGLKGKLLDSMIYSTPNVTTSIGAEGLQGVLPWNGFIYDDPIQFADRSVELHENEELWTVSRNIGIDLLRSRFKRSLFVDRFIARIEDLLRNKDDHRARNHMGAILWMNSMQSSKYLSRWIELKNRKQK